jgi:hypothetical protein
MERLGLVSAIKSRFEALAPFLDERRRRLAAASEALAVQRHRSPQHARGNRQISAPLHLECGGRKPILRKESDPKCPRARVQPEGGGRGHRACGKRLRAARPRAPIASCRAPWRAPTTATDLECGPRYRGFGKIPQLILAFPIISPMTMSVSAMRMMQSVLSEGRRRCCLQPAASCRPELEAVDRVGAAITSLPQPVRHARLGAGRPLHARGDGGGRFLHHLSRQRRDPRHRQPPNPTGGRGHHPQTARRCHAGIRIAPTSSPNF